jgi:hypothetical protein
MAHYRRDDADPHREEHSGFRRAGWHRDLCAPQPDQGLVIGGIAEAGPSALSFLLRAALSLCPADRAADRVVGVPHRENHVVAGREAFLQRDDLRDFCAGCSPILADLRRAAVTRNIPGHP